MLFTKATRDSKEYETLAFGDNVKVIISFSTAMNGKEEISEYYILFSTFLSIPCVNYVLDDYCYYCSNYWNYQIYISVKTDLQVGFGFGPNSAFRAEKCFSQNKTLHSTYIQ